MGHTHDAAAATPPVVGAADRLELHELAARYGLVIDDRDWEGLAAVFTPGAVFELRGFPRGDERLEGLDAIRAHMMTARHPVAHHVTNVVVDAGDHEVRLRSKIIGSGPQGRVRTASRTG